jgi:hypothetical protein
MKKVIIIAVLAFGTMTIFTACERNDYQHPLHRK